MMSRTRFGSKLKHPEFASQVSQERREERLTDKRPDHFQHVVDIKGTVLSEFSHQFGVSFTLLSEQVEFLLFVEETSLQFDELGLCQFQVGKNPCFRGCLKVQSLLCQPFIHQLTRTGDQQVKIVVSTFLRLCLCLKITN